MKTVRKSRNFSVLIGSYLVLTLLIFSVFLLSWSYHSSTMAIDKELRSSFNQRQMLAENILENQSEIIASGINHIASNPSFLERIINGDKHMAQDLLFKILDSEMNYSLDLVFISLDQASVWVDASSSIYDLETILPKLAAENDLAVSGSILRFQEGEADLTLLVLAVPVIHPQSGKVIGRLFGGLILDDNLSLLEKIKTKTQSSIIACFHGNHLVGATQRYDSKEMVTLVQAMEKMGAGEIFRGDNIIASYGRLHFHGQETPLEIIMSISDQPFRDMRRLYLGKTITLLILATAFFLVSVFFIRSFIYPSLKRLLTYSEAVTKGEADARYAPGRISELNRIGHSMENMVESLEKAGREIRAEIAERKRTQEILRSTDIRLKTLVKTIPDLIWLKDQDGRYLFCNSRFERLYGAKEEDIVGKTDYDFVDRELADFFREHDRRAIEKGGPSINEEEVRYADDGHKESLETIKTPIYGEDGAVIGVLGIARDITDRKEHFEQFKTVMDSLNSLVYVADMETYEILFINKYGIDIWGDITGQICWKTLQTGETGPCAYCTNDMLLDDQNRPAPPLVWEHQNTANNQWYECRDQAIRWMDGRFVRMEIAYNITERKEAEFKQQQLEDTLRQSQKMEAIGTLAGGIAHDFNNILGIIIGNADLAFSKIPKENPAQKNLTRIKTAGMRAKDVVFQLLSYSRKTELNPKPVALIPLVEESMKLIRASVPTSIDLRASLGHDEYVIRADATQIQQVIINLCTNAAHAMEVAGGVLTIELRRAEPDESGSGAEERNPYVVLSVTDTGHGIDPKIREKIFDPYFTTKEVGKGSGMGLSIVHSIVKNHEGEIRIKDNPLGEGTRVEVRLPLCDDGAADELTDDEYRAAGGQRILFVDDETAMVEMGEDMLHSLGYRVEAVQTAAKAIERFNRAPESFDLMITDMTMPGMSGARLAQEIRRIRPDIPIIICTGYSRLMNEAKARKAGFSAFVMKPLDKKRIASVIEEVLAKA